MNQTPTPKSIESFLKTIAEEIDRLNTIIKDFLSLARSGNIEKVLVDLQGYFDDIVALARLESEKQHIAIDVDIEPGLTANLDRSGNEESVSQFDKERHAGNRIQGQIRNYCPEDSLPGKSPSISAIPVRRSLRIYASKIWQPYFTTRKDGTGLGLAICRRIVADHGGTIELLEGKPTTFRIVV